MPNLIDLTGEKYGRLTVISQAENNNYRRVQWKCICDCGNYCIVSSNCLRAGHTKSCGCLATEERAKRAQKAGLARATKGGNLRFKFLFRCKDTSSFSEFKIKDKKIQPCFTTELH